MVHDIILYFTKLHSITLYYTPTRAEAEPEAGAMQPFQPASDLLTGPRGIIVIACSTI